MQPTSAAEGLAACVNAGEDTIRDCYAAALKDLVENAEDPLAAVDEITQVAREDPGGFLLPNCHGLMHTVGREYARDNGLTVAALKDSLPKSNDPGCPAGYAHGVVTGVAPQIDPRDPKASESVCDDSATRYERYSCTHGFGHAFMRISNEELPAALALCSKLGKNSAPDCAQGAFHDYWFSVGGYDDTQKPSDAETDPQKLCGAQKPEYVRQCWYRAFVDNRPPGAIESAVDVDRLCMGLEGLQREGVHHRRYRDRPGRPAGAVLALLRVHREGGPRVRARAEAPEPPRLVERAVRGGARPLRCAPGAGAARLLPLAREDRRRAHRREVRDRRLSARPGQASARGVRRGRPDDGRAARDLQLATRTLNVPVPSAP